MAANDDETLFLDTRGLSQALIPLNANATTTPTSVFITVGLESVLSCSNPRFKKVLVISPCLMQWMRFRGRNFFLWFLAQASSYVGILSVIFFRSGQIKG